MNGLTALLFVLALAAPSGASAQDLADTCRPAEPHVANTVCHGGDVIERDVRAHCRRNVTDACQPDTSEAAIKAFEGSWTSRALAFQHRLGDGVPFRNAPWFGTHNSFNSIAEMGPTLSDTDANQQLSLVEQLRVGVRSIELDLHWFPSAQAGAMAPVVCHSEGSAGCTIEKPLADVLPELGDWLRAHSDQVILLYLENQLDGEEGSTAAAAVVDDVLGDLVYKPAGPAGQCVDLPQDATRRDVRAAGKQIVIVSNCGDGAAWRGMSFGWSTHEEGQPDGFGPGCHADYDRATFDAKLIRYYEDDTWLTAVAAGGEPNDKIDAATAALMTRCGVDLFGFDHLRATDPRHASLVWSWAPDEDPESTCAVMRADGRWAARSCGERHRFVCRSADGSTRLTTKSERGNRPPSGCGLPRTGRENEVAKAAAGGQVAWLALTSPHKGGGKKSR